MTPITLFAWYNLHSRTFSTEVIFIGRIPQGNQLNEETVFISEHTHTLFQSIQSERAQSFRFLYYFLTNRTRTASYVCIQKQKFRFRVLRYRGSSSVPTCFRSHSRLPIHHASLYLQTQTSYNSSRTHTNTPLKRQCWRANHLEIYCKKVTKHRLRIIL